MTNKEIAQRLRGIELTGDMGSITDLANELDPPLPMPGTVVWWRTHGRVLWEPGLMHSDGSPIIVRDDGSHVNPDSVTIKHARILAPDEVAVKVPPVSEWPRSAQVIAWNWNYKLLDSSLEQFQIITRAKAERLESK